MPRHPGSPLPPLRLAAALALLAPIPACVNDPDCGVCDPDNLILQSIAGTNYAGKLVRLLGPECVGDRCPGQIQEGEYFVETIGPCDLSPEAIAAGRGADEWCRVSPLMVDSGLQFIFNNLLDPASVELVRKQPANPNLFEVYDWKTQIVHLEGPIARFNGDYFPGATPTAPDLVRRVQSLACIDNLRRLGKNYDDSTDPTVCDGTHTGPDGRRWPLRAQLLRIGADGREAPTTVETWRGETDTRQRASSCTSPQNGPDTCCELCDHELAVNVAKYGVLAPVPEDQRPGERRREFTDAIACDPAGDVLRECQQFIPHVYRGDELRSFEYTWDGARQRFHVPRPDKLRETHPALRPADAEQRTIPCKSDGDCRDDARAALPGTQCVGHLQADPARACTRGDDCVERSCVAAWFATCAADPDTTGPQGYCVDARWSGKGVAACFVNQDPYYICEATGSCEAEDFADPRRRQGKGSRMSLADSDGDGRVEAIEACRDTLGGGDRQTCDPLFQPGVAPVARHDRLETLPTPARSCICEDDPAAGCQDFVDSLCREGGDKNRPIAADRRGEYAIKFVTRTGGVVYDPALKGVLFQPADLGGLPRSLVERCAQERAGAAALNIKDGWRAHDDGPELFEDADRAMCSSAQYRVVFTTPQGPGEPAREHLRDKVGNTLAGKSTYLLRTPDFHVRPGSGAPGDNLRIGACVPFALGFSNKYDLSEGNLKKIELLEISADPTDPAPQILGRIAGGTDCSEAPDADIPCLTVDVAGQGVGTIEVRIDTQRFGADRLQAGHRYRLHAPGLTLAKGETVFDVIAAGGDRYHAAFWDACGMPLVTGMPTIAGSVHPDDYHHDFTIDLPRPREDQEQDGVQFSCDNAPDDYNPDQGDMDRDGAGDIVDLCPTIPEANTTADTDKDGVGNACDRCPRQPSQYNEQAAAADAELYMLVRNIPHQTDTDQDGIGDACDNCVVRPNCGDFGPAADGLRPAGISEPVPREDDGVCQSDIDAWPYLGDACAPGGLPLQLPGAAAPVGFQHDDDFDQDGIRNLSDKCPRFPVARVQCDTPDDCPNSADCTDGVCNHVDSDNDGHGDLCDSCPAVKNPGQTQDGSLQSDDPDDDFVGNDCETTPACADHTADPRRIAFYSEVSQGQCCVRLFADELALHDPGLARRDPDTGTCEVLDPAVPLRATCPEDQDNVTCRPLPARVLTRPGMALLPAGCAGEGTPLTLDSPGIDGDENRLYDHLCHMPQSDQDFDGIGDACDLCPFAFDPENSFYKDTNNKVWPKVGKYCSGEYDPEKAQQTCEALDGEGDSSEGSGSSSA
jgi:hypothetical protein